MKIKNQILDLLRSYADNARKSCDSKNEKTKYAKNTYTGDSLGQELAQINAAYNSSMIEENEKIMSALNLIETEARKKVADIVTKTLSDDELRDLEFIDNYGIEALKGNSTLLGMYADKHKNSYPFMSALADKTGIHYDNTGVPLTQLDSLFEGAKKFCQEMQIDPDYPNSIACALALDDRASSFGAIANKLDSFMEAYN